MNSILFFVLVFMCAATCNGARILKNFIILLDGNNFANIDENVLSNLIASPILKTAPRIIPDSDILINYSVKFPYFGDPVPIPFSKSYTMDYFRDFVRKNTFNVNVLPLALLNVMLEKTPPFSDILMITNAEPETSSDSLLNVLDLMNSKRINVVVRTFDGLINSSETDSYLYYNTQKTNISDEYRRINKQTKAMRSEMFFSKVLKQVLTKDENKPIRNSTISIINGMAFYNYLQVWDFALRVGVFLSEFNRTKLFSFNEQVMWINDFSVVYAFENDYTVKIDLTAEYIPGTYIDVLTDHCKNENIRRKMNFAMKKRMKHSSYDQKSYDEFWHKESTKIKFPLDSLAKSLIECPPKSVIYVLTDVLPGSTELIPSILKLMEDKEITVNVMYFGEKSDLNPDPDEYVQINKASIIAL